MALISVMEATGKMSSSAIPARLRARINCYFSFLCLFFVNKKRSLLLLLLFFSV